MKRAGLFLAVFCVAALAYARDFKESWVEKMADYIGKGIYDVRLDFIPIDNGYANVLKEKAGGLLGIGGRNVVQIIYANSGKKVECALWYMDSWLGSDETRELADIEKLLTSKYGTSVKSGGDLVWTWKKSGGILGMGAQIYQISICRDSSDGSACVLIQRQNSGFQNRWQLLLRGLGIKKG